MSRPIYPLAIILCVLTVPVAAQTILVGQSQLTFTAQPGATSAVQSLVISSTTGGLPFTVSFTPIAGGNWLTFSPASGSLPATVFMAANAGTLGPGVYSGTFTITAPGATNSPLSLPATFNVGVVGSATITANPTSLSFFGLAGGVNPGAQTISVGSLIGAINFITTVSTQSAAGWLQVNPFAGTTPSNLQVTVNTAGLAAGLHYGGITITPSSGPPVVVPVTLNLSWTSTLQVSNSALQFYYQVGGTFPAAQTVNFTNTDSSAPLNFSLTPSTNSGGNWLFVTPLTANTPQSITIAANPGGLPPGTYTGNIAVTSANAVNFTQNIAITLTVSATPLLTLSTPPAPFNFQTGTAPPAGRTVQLGSTGGSLSFSVTTATSTGNWLVVGPTLGVTPATLTVGVNPTGLQAGTYTGVVTVTAPGASNSPQSFTVTLSVNTVAILAVSPQSLIFSYQIGTGLSVFTQSISITAGGASVPVTVAPATATCGNWLQVFQSSAVTPTAVSVGVNTAGLTLPQVCSGTLNISAATGLIQVPVTLNISNNPLLVVSPLALNFTVPFEGQISSTQAIALSATDGSAITFNASSTTTTGGSWLTAGPTQGTTPVNITVAVSAFGLNPGNYTGAVTIISPGLPGPLSVPVNLTVTAVTTAIATPTALSFTSPQGGTPPSSQNLTITTTGGSFGFTATPLTSGGLGWLQVAPAGGSTPSTLSISVNPTGLATGTYGGSISIAIPGSSNNPLVVPVTLTIVTAQGISASPGSFVFNYVIGTVTNPGSQALIITGTGGPVSFTASASTTGGGNWLSISQSSGTTPQSIALNVNPSGLTPGTYTGQVSVVAPGILGSPIIVPVTLTIQPSPGPSLAGLANAASGGRGAFSAGEIVTAAGSVLGPAAPATFTVNAQGNVDTQLAGTRLLFDGFPSAILYTSQGQVNAIVPYEVAGRQLVQVQAEYQGQRSQAVTISMVTAAPGIFTANSSGTGQGAILNQDSSINSSSNRAGKGTVVQIFATGEGQTDPPGVTGAVTRTVLRKPLREVTATVGGIPAEVTYAGSAPGAVLGLFQVNVKIPESAPSGPDVPVVISVGGVSSQGSVTVAII